MKALGYGPLTAKICILVDYPRIPSTGSLFTDWERNFVEARLRKARLSPTQIRFESLHPDSRCQIGSKTYAELWEKLGRLTNCTTVITFGNQSLRVMTGLSGIDKWQCSPLDAVPESPVKKVIPTFSLARLNKQYELNFWLDMAFYKAKKNCEIKNWARKEHNFNFNLTEEEINETLAKLVAEPRLGVDIETGRGQINTIGFSWTEKDAVAINVLPGNYTEGSYYKIWEGIRNILEGPSRKIMQNGIYEIMWFSTYGIRLNNFYHDTMWANKFLWPELEKGLASVGRIYTNEPYWKDEGKAVGSNGGKKDWGNIRDWDAHYRYNCLDTTGTFEACENQLSDLKERNLIDLWKNHVMKVEGPLAEMCLRGLPIDEDALHAGKTRLEKEIKELKSQLTNDINPSSPKQKLELFKEKGYKIPRVRDAKTNGFKESLNELALKKLRRKYPEDNDIKLLLEIGPKQKALSSYFNVEYEGSNVNYMLDGHGTETGRWSCSKDHRGQGYNAQTLPKYAKKYIAWTKTEDRYFMQCDLKQAESRFVAYDSADSDLIKYLEDDTKDIHSYVASEIFGCSVEQVIKEKNEGNPEKRQLGKKAGHGANYAMRETTFMDSCLKEMDLSLSKKEAKKVLESYHKLFPGVRAWHAKIRDAVRMKKMLDTPMGRVRYFFGRMNDDTFREAYAYRPQSTVPDITSCLMLNLWEERKKGNLDFWFHLQVHDSLVISCEKNQIEKIADFMRDTDKWHPEIILPAGKLVIPVECEVGKCLGELSELH